jgi:hypothetical protein
MGLGEAPSSNMQESFCCMKRGEVCFPSRDIRYAQLNDGLRSGQMTPRGGQFLRGLGCQMSTPSRPSSSIKAVGSR